MPSWSFANLWAGGICFVRWTPDRGDYIVHEIKFAERIDPERARLFVCGRPGRVDEEIQPDSLGIRRLHPMDFYSAEDYADMRDFSPKMANAWINQLGMKSTEALVKSGATGDAILDLFTSFVGAEPADHAKRALQQCAKWIKRDVIPALAASPS